MPRWSYSALICTLGKPKELPWDIKHTESELLVHLMLISKMRLKQERYNNSKLYNTSAELALKICHCYTPSNIAGSANERGNHTASHGGEENCLTGVCKANQMHFLTACPSVLLSFGGVAPGNL